MTITADAARRRHHVEKLDNLDLELVAVARLLASARSEVDVLRQRARSLKARRATAARYVRANR